MAIQYSINPAVQNPPFFPESDPFAGGTLVTTYGIPRFSLFTGAFFEPEVIVRNLPPGASTTLPFSTPTLGIVSSVLAQFQSIPNGHITISHTITASGGDLNSVDVSPNALSLSILLSDDEDIEDLIVTNNTDQYFAITYKAGEGFLDESANISINIAQQSLSPLAVTIDQIITNLVPVGGGGGGGGGGAVSVSNFKDLINLAIQNNKQSDPNTEASGNKVYPAVGPDEIP